MPVKKLCFKTSHRKNGPDRVGFLWEYGIPHYSSGGGKPCKSGVLLTRWNFPASRGPVRTFIPAEQQDFFQAEKQKEWQNVWQKNALFVTITVAIKKWGQPGEGYNTRPTFYANAKPRTM